MSFFKKKFQSILGKYPFSRIDFIIAGTQKGGTTALYEYFRLHQNICMADKKELHFFDEDRYFEKKNPNYSKYHRYFSPNDHSQVIGEATPIYMYWNKSIERIYVYNPQIKLIIILRNPIDGAFSHWNMERDKGRERRTFLKAILDEESKINSPNVIAFFGNLDSLNNKKIARLGNTIMSDDFFKNHFNYVFSDSLEIYIKPKLFDYVIEFGLLDNIESKLTNYKLFYAAKSESNSKCLCKSLHQTNPKRRVFSTKPFS